MLKLKKKEIANVILDKTLQQHINKENLGREFKRSYHQRRFITD